MKTEKPQNTDNKIRMIEHGKGFRADDGNAMSIKENGSTCSVLIA
jgi:hypothetical protein